MTTHFFLGLHYGRPYLMTRSSTSVLATSRAACFTCILDNTIFVSLLCSRPPPFHAFLHPVLLYFLPLCSMSTLFCSPCWASPTEGVFCSFHCFAVAYSSKTAPSSFWPLPLQTLGYSDFALRARCVFSYVRKLLWYISLLQLCFVERWVGLVGLHPCVDVLASTLILDITSDGSIRFRTFADLRLSFLQLHEQPQAPRL